MTWILIITFQVWPEHASQSCTKLSDCWNSEKAKESKTCFRGQCRSFSPNDTRCEDDKMCGIHGKCVNNTRTCSKDWVTQNLNCSEKKCPYGDVCWGVKFQCHWGKPLYTFPNCSTDKDCADKDQCISPNLGCFPKNQPKSCETGCDEKQECRYGYCVAKYNGFQIEGSPENSTDKPKNTATRKPKKKKPKNPEKLKKKAIKNVGTTMSTTTYQFFLLHTLYNVFF